MKKRSNHAFTVTELMIVVCVIGILAAILVPTFANVVKTANSKSALSDAKNMLTSYLTARMDKKNLTKDLVFFVYNKSAFYVYGYTTKYADGVNNGILTQSTGNPFTGYQESEFTRFITENNLTGEFDPSADYTDSDKYFYLVPNNSAEGAAPIATRALVETSIASAYNCLDDDINGQLTSTNVFEGYLLPGKYTAVDSTEAGTSGLDGITYLVTFDGGTRAADPNLGLPSSGFARIPANQSLSYVTSNYVPTCAGWQFRGWSVDNDNVADPGILVTHNMTLYAVWVESSLDTFMVRLMANGGAFNDLRAPWVVVDGVAGRTFNQGTDISPFVSEVYPTKEGVIFMGWQGLTTPYLLADDIDFVANWSDVYYNLIFDDNAPTGETVSNMPGNTQVTPNATVNLFGYAPTCSGGYILTGWKVTPQGGSVTNYGLHGQFAMPTTDVTIKPVWDMPKFTVEYYNESQLVDSTQYEVGTSSITIREAVPNTESGTFAGWGLMGTDTTLNPADTYDTSAVEHGATLKFNAKFTINSYTVSFVNSDDETEIYKEQTVVHGGNATPPTTPPEKVGYDFMGWDGSYVNVTADTIIRTIWRVQDEPVTVVVTFYDTWNESNVDIVTLPNVPAGTTELMLADVPIADWPEFFTAENNDGTPNVTVAQTVNGNTVTLNGVLEKTVTDVTYRLITTRTGFERIDETDAFMSANYMLNNNISFDGINFTPLGKNNATTENNKVAFTGVFDGADKIISNFSCVTTETDIGVGMFARNEGTIRNLGISCSGNVVGGSIVGVVTGRNSGTISGCAVTSANLVEARDETVGTGGCVGGISGVNSAGATVTDCYTNVYSISAFSAAGGIVGDNYGNISECISESGINEDSFEQCVYTTPSTLLIRYAGGIAGINRIGLISDCDVLLSSYSICATLEAGGIVGRLESGSISGCDVLVNNINIAAWASVGGIAGFAKGNIIDCHVQLSDNPGAVDAANIFAYGTCNYELGADGDNEGAYVGGIAGHIEGCMVTRCSFRSDEATNLIASAAQGSAAYYNWFVGGIAGAVVGNSTVSQCWVYKAQLNRHLTSGTADDIGCLQHVGGIAGYNQSGSTITNSWTQAVVLTAYGYAGGIAGSNGGTISQCWTNFSGATYIDGSYIGDIISANANADFGGTVTNCAYVTGSGFSSLGTSYATLENTIIPSWDYATTWTVSAADSRTGPQLSSNEFKAVTITIE